MKDYLFVRIPKTASTSVCHALGKMCEHKTALELRDEVPDFNERYKFTIVRHPYDRFLSMFYFFSALYGQGYDNPNDFLENVAWETIQKHHDYQFLRPQTDFICDNNHNVLVDYVGRFEALNESWGIIKKELGLTAELGHKRPAFRKKEKLNEKSKQKVYELYRRDFEVLGYGSDS